jgi:hypothetical protein
VGRGGGSRTHLLLLLRGTPLQSSPVLGRP